MELAPEPGRSLRPRLDGADPLLRIVAREFAVGPRQDVVQQGDAPCTAHLLVSGMACCYRLLSDGRRQTTAILVPGDLCDLAAAVTGHADYSVETLVPCILGEIPAAEVDDLDDAHPELRRALWRQVLRSEAIAREWMVGMGRRSARERLAHFLCELRERLGKVGLCHDDTYGFALTRSEFADVLGVSTVHVNRTLQDLRKDSLIELEGKVMHILDHAALVRIAGFDPNYLQRA